MKKVVKCYFTMKVSNNIHNVMVLDEAEFVQEFADRQKSVEKLKSKLSSYALAPKDRNAFIEKEKQYSHRDQNILETKEVKNTLEAYAYEMRSNIEDGGSLVNFVDPQQRDQFIKEINEVVDWLYADGQNGSP